MTKTFKHSGVEWLGEIPSHWEVRKMKFVFQESSIKNRADLPQLAATQSNGVVPKDSLTFKSVQVVTSDLNSFKVVKKNNFVISLRSFEGGIEHSNFEGIISPAYTILQNAAKIEFDYFRFLFKSPAFISSLGQYKTGIREGQNISYTELQNDFLPLPPLDEQRKIAEFLDEKCGKIAEFIAKKQALIALLKERKKALINEAVCGRLNLDASATPCEFKRSGVEWLGEIPHHWEVRKLKFVSRINENTLPETTDKNFEFDYIDIGSISENQIQNLQHFKFDLAPSRARRIVKDNCIIISMVRTYLRAICFIEKGQNLIASTGFAVCQPIESKIHPIFMKFIFNAEWFINHTIAISNGVNYPAMNSLDFENLKIPLPPKNEQQKIAEFLDKKCAELDRACALIQAQIEAMREYKSSLIDSAVRGKFEFERTKNEV